MLKPNTQQHIKFITVEKPTAWLVVAVLVEMMGDEMVSVSEPKVVKIIQKACLRPACAGRRQALALKGSTQSQFLLSAPAVVQLSKSQAQVSPYFAFIFGSEKSNFITGLAAQPPTR